MIKFIQKVNQICSLIQITDVKDLDVELPQAEVIDLAQFEQEIAKDNIQIVDVRNEKEYAEGHVPGAIHAFVGTLARMRPQVY